MMAKHVVQRLGDEIGKIKEAEIVTCLTDVRKLLAKNPPSGTEDEAKTRKAVLGQYFISSLWDS